MENDQTTSTQEVNVDGGWLITHWTRTWDTRVPLTQLSDQVAAAQAEVDAAQKKLDDLSASQATFQAQIDAAVAAKVAADAAAVLLTPPSDQSASSTPMR